MDMMSDAIDSSAMDIKTAYHLLLHSRVIEAKNKGDTAAEKAAREELEKDSAEISEGAKASQSASVSAAGSTVETNVDIRLSDMFQIFKTGQNQTEGNQTAQVVEFKETVETRASLTVHDLERVDGLVVKNKNLAVTDRYSFEFSDGSTFKITDKWSGRSTTIWGDPHVDTSDEEGTNNGDFKDLKGSDQYTTFMLQDGTRLTITAKDTGVIEKVDIFKEGQHLSGTGSGSKEWSVETGLFAKSVDNNASFSLSDVPLGDTVYAGGDGNDWFDASRNLVWGKTTGLAVTARPNAYIEFKYEQWITQQFSMVQVNQQA
jgi:hypothetical protein